MTSAERSPLILMSFWSIGVSAKTSSSSRDQWRNTMRMAKPPAAKCGHPPRPGAQRARQCKPGKDTDNDGRPQRRVRDARAHEPRAHMDEHTIKPPQAVDDAVRNGAFARFAPASEPVERGVERSKQREHQKARNERGKRCRRREKRCEMRKHGEAPWWPGMIFRHGSSGTLALTDGNCKTDRARWQEKDQPRAPAARSK